MKVRKADGEVVEVEDAIVVVVSSKSGSTEIQMLPDGSLLEVHHLKSGRDEVFPVSEIPANLTIRYKEPYPWAFEIQENVVR